MNKRLIKILGVMCIATTTFAFTGCGNNNIEEKVDNTQEQVQEDITKEENNIAETEEINFSKETNPIVTFEVEGFGTIKAELYPEVAPNTVKNFIELVNKGFYDGLTFHRVVDDFVIQGGDPIGNGTGDAGYTIKGEFSSNGVENKLSHDVGVLSMARAMDNDSASSQFFIVTGEAKYLDGSYAGFGKVIEGMDVVEKIDNLDVDIDDMPIEKVTIKTVTVDTKGQTYEPAEKIE